MNAVSPSSICVTRRVDKNPRCNLAARAKATSVALAAWIATAQLMAAPSLFLNIESLPVNPETASTQQFRVELDTAALAANAATLTIAFPGQMPVEAARSEFFEAGSSSTWRGRTREGHDVLLTSSGDAVRGRIYTSEGSFAINPDRAGGNQLSRLDNGALPRDAAVTPAIPHEVAPKSSVTTVSGGDGVAIVDVLVAFSNEVAQSVGDQAQLDLFAQAAIDQTNLVLENSQVDTFRVRLVKAARVTRAGSGNPQTDLPQVRQDAEINVLRADVGADVVMFVADYTSGFNGLAYKNNRPLQYGPAFAGYAYAVVDRAGVENSLLFVHELGHILGMDHDVGSPHDAPADNSFPFAYGHVAPREQPFAQGVVTVMAYQGSCGGSSACQQVPYLSNSNIAPPQAPYDGRPLGVLDQSENFRVAKIVGPITADFLVPDVILSSSFEVE